MFNKIIKIKGKFTLEGDLPGLGNSFMPKIFKSATIVIVDTSPAHIEEMSAYREEEDV